MCQILTQSARKSSGKGGRYNGRTTTADRAGTSKRKETSDKGRDRRKRTDGSESTVGQSDAAVIPDSYAEKGIQKKLILLPLNAFYLYFPVSPLFYIRDKSQTLIISSA